MTAKVQIFFIVLISLTSFIMCTDKDLEDIIAGMKRDFNRSTKITKRITAEQFAKDYQEDTTKGQLGQGATSKVDVVHLHSDKNHCFARKKFNSFASMVPKEGNFMQRNGAAKPQIGKIIDEISVMEKISHDDIIKIHAAYHDDEGVKVLMECATNGTLERMRTRNLKQHFTVKEVCHYFKSVTRGLAHMHSLNIMHRDIKPANILITADNKAKLADFGSAVLIPPGEKITGNIGTLQYKAPEVVSRSYDESADVWSLGAAMYESLFGNLMFESHDLAKTGQIIFPPDHENATNEVRDLMPKMLNRNEAERIKAADILKHDFFTNNC